MIKKTLITQKTHFVKKKNRWAMQPGGKAKGGAGGAVGSADVEWTDEELERQTRYFQVSFGTEVGLLKCALGLFWDGIGSLLAWMRSLLGRNWVSVSEN